MKVSIAIVLFSVLVVALAFPADEKYTNKYDSVNIDEILANSRLFNNYFGCLMDEPGAKCTSDAKVLRDTLPDALNTGCAKCTEKQKEGAKKVIKFLSDKHPDKWEKLQAKYDPEGNYKKTYQNEAAEIGI